MFPFMSAIWTNHFWQWTFVLCIYIMITVDIIRSLHCRDSIWGGQNWRGTTTSGWQLKTVLRGWKISPTLTLNNSEFFETVITNSFFSWNHFSQNLFGNFDFTIKTNVSFLFLNLQTIIYLCCSCRKCIHLHLSLGRLHELFPWLPELFDGLWVQLHALTNRIERNPCQINKVPQPWLPKQKFHYLLQPKMQKNIQLQKNHHIFSAFY